jgi:glycosyltransferase involved in cell wall biosynthesis
VAALRGMRPFVVYGSTPHLLAPVAGWLLARRYRVPFILEVRDLWPQILVEMDRLERGSWTYRVLSRIENWLYRRAVRIVVLAEGVRDELVRRGVDGAKIVVIPNGAAPTDFAVGAPRDGLRDRYQFRDRVFVYAGAHGPANGLDLLLDAAELVRDDHPEAHFVLFGDGPSKAELVASTRSRGLDNVEFRDPVPKSAMPEVLAAADVGVHVLADVPLFRYGVSPNKVVDYMAAGLPVLTNSPGVVGDLVASAGAGVAVEPGDLEKGIRAVLRLSPEERAARGDAGRMYIARERSPAVLAERLEALLDSLV